MSAPTFSIVVEIEAPIRLVVDVLNESVEIRLKDWVRAHPDLLALVQRAIELRNAARSAS